MEKIAKVLIVVVICLLLQGTAVSAEDITICYKGKSLTLSLENSERFFELGARRGECPESDKEDSGKGQDEKETGSGSGQEQEHENKQTRNSDSGKEQDQGHEQKQEQQQKESSGENKVIVCHKSKHTIVISESALKAHLAHGDSIGTCTGEQQSIGQSRQQLQQTGTDVKSEDARKSGGDAEKKQKNRDKGGKEKKDKGMKSK